MTYKLLIGGYTSKGLRVINFDPSKDEKLVLQESAISAGSDPSWIIQHPSDPSIIVGTNEVDDGRVVAIKLSGLDANEVNGDIVANVSSGGTYPAHLLLLKDSIIAGNYMGGSILDLPYSTSPLDVTDAAKDAKEGTIVKFSGTGPNEQRQESSHPHEVYLHGDELLIPDLGADKVWRLVKGASGWELKGAIEYPAGSGPRHILIHDGILYTVLELSNQLAIHKFASLPDSPTQIATLSTYPSGAPPAEHVLAAEILLSPNKKFIYVSNRNDPSTDGDIVAVYNVHTESNPSKLTRGVRSGVTHARGMNFSKDGKYFAVVGNHSGSIRIYEVDDASEDGEVKLVAGLHGVLEKPTAVIWL